MLILMVFEFWHLDHLGPRKVDFSDFGPHTGKFYLVIFSKNQKFVQKWPKWGLFCSEFCTDYCAVVCLGLARTTYAKIAKNRRKIGQNWLALNSIFSKLRSKSGKLYRQFLRILLVMIDQFSVWLHLLWGFQKSVLFGRQYFDLWHRINAWAYSNFFSGQLF